MLLILTYSRDQTVDDLISLLPEIPIFRFNIDLWRNYEWEVNDIGFTILDPVGRRCEERSTQAVYLRKLIFEPPFIDVPSGGNEEAWRREELLQLFHAIRDLALASGKLALVKPSMGASKIRQMRIARRWFPVPAWKAILSKNVQGFVAGTVVKTFGATPVGEGAHMLVRDVDVSRLSPEFPWFIQEKVLATHDVTVVYVNGHLFPFELKRDFEGADSRLATALNNLEWPQCEIAEDEAVGIRAMMSELGLTFGRFDFLRVDGRLWFLEVNPNGQWGWLDLRQSNGLYRAVADEIRAVWKRNRLSGSGRSLERETTQ